MKVVKPITIGNAALAASSVPEPDASFGEVSWVADRRSVLDLGYGLNSGEYIGDTSCNGDSIFTLTSSITPSVPRRIYKLNLNGGYEGLTINESACVAIASTSQYIYSLLRYISSGVDSAFVKKYSMDGTLIIQHDITSSVLSVSGICVREGFCYVSNPVNGEVKVFSESSFELISTLKISPGISIYGLDNYNDLIISSDTSSKSVIMYDTQFVEQSRFSVSEQVLSSSNLGPCSVNGRIVVPTNNPSDEGNAFIYNDGVYGGYYNPEDKAILTSTHRSYKCVIATNDKPSEGVNKKPQTWVDIGPTNKWAPFDSKISTTLKSNSTYTNAIKDTENLGIGSVSAFGLNNVSSINIRATSASSGLMFNQTYPIVDTDELSITGIPPMTDYTINMTFNKSSGGALEVGAIVPGKIYDLGSIQAGATSDVIDYSKSEYDEFGELVYVQRPIVKYSTYPIVIDRQYSMQASRLLNTLRGIPCVWIGNIGLGQELVTYGSYERSPMTYNNPSIVELQIKVRGVI